MTGDRCVVCGAGTHRPADACARCKRILDRVETRRDASGGLIATELAQVFGGGTFDQGAFPDQSHAGVTRRPPPNADYALALRRKVRCGPAARIAGSVRSSLPWAVAASSD